MLVHQIPEVHKIHTTDTETRTNIPSVMLNKVRPWLDKAGVEYKVLTGKQIPDDFIQGWHFRGRSSVKHTAVIISHLDSKELHDAIEELDFISEEDLI